MKYGILNLGQIEAIVNKLGGMEGVQRFLSGETVVKTREQIFPTWKTIKLGTGFKTADDFRGAIKSAGMFIVNLGNEILNFHAFTVSTEETEVDLVVVSNAELGFNGGAKLEDTCARALELGLELCPNEVGPQLRLQYEDQPYGGLIIVTDLIDSGLRLVFNVSRDGGGDVGRRFLSGSYDSPRDFWSADSRFVFCRRRVVLPQQTV